MAQVITLSVSSHPCPDTGSALQLIGTVHAVLYVCLRQGTAWLVLYQAAGQEFCLWVAQCKRQCIPCSLNVRVQARADEVCEGLSQVHPAVALHGDISQAQRDRALQAFRLVFGVAADHLLVHSLVLGHIACAI